jgi:hypothetical protein
MGPIVLFDKSFIEMLNVDEAALFDFLFLTNICPMFLTEVLADLEKERAGERTREKIVADVAQKTPSAHSYPNMMHTSICLAKLHGRPTKMDGRPVLGGGRPVSLQGQLGVYYEESPEVKAYSRWQEGKFLEVERGFAKHWRAQLAAADLSQSAALAREALSIRSDPKSLADAMTIAREAVLGDRNRYRTFRAAYALLGLPAAHWPQVLSNWKIAGGPPLADYAPYTAHCLLVDVFFHVAVSKKLISPDRISNRVDIAYLYYLPFAMVFVSNDKLHKRIVPLLLRADQLFIDGEELKRDLRALDAHYSALPHEQLEQGLFRFAEPPDDDRFLTTRLYRAFGLRVGQSISLSPDQNKKVGADVLAVVEAMTAQPTSPTSDVAWRPVESADHVTIERRLSVRRGKWRVMSPEAEASARKHNAS